MDYKMIQPDIVQELKNLYLQISLKVPYGHGKYIEIVKSYLFCKVFITYFFIFNKDCKNIFFVKIYKRKEGALVLDISADTPAAKFGLKRGDLIYAINAKPIKDKTSLQNTIASFQPNEKVTIELERDGKIVSTKEIGITTSGRPAYKWMLNTKN